MEGLTPKKSMKWKSALYRLTFSALALAIVFSVVDRNLLLDALGTISVSAWLGGLLGFLLLHAVTALKWRFILRICGLRITSRVAFQAYGFGLFANLCLPSLVGGDVVRAGVLIKKYGSKETIVFAALVDRLLDVLGLGVLVAIGFLAAPTAFSEFDSSNKIQQNLIILGTMGVIMAGLGLPMILRRLHPRRMPRKIGFIWIGFLRAWRQLTSQPKRALKAFLWCFGLQAGFVLVNLLIGLSMEIDLDPRLWFLLWPLAKIAAMAPLSLGGIGIREVAFVALAGSFVSKSLLLAQSLVWESILIAGGLIFGGASMVNQRTGHSPDD